MVIKPLLSKNSTAWRKWMCTVRRLVTSDGPKVRMLSMPMILTWLDQSSFHSSWLEPSLSSLIFPGLVTISNCLSLLAADEASQIKSDTMQWFVVARLRMNCFASNSAVTLEKTLFSHNLLLIEWWFKYLIKHQRYKTDVNHRVTDVRVKTHERCYQHAYSNFSLLTCMRK